MISRRGIFVGMGSLIAAPAVVWASSLMPVKAFDPFYFRYLALYDIGTDEMVLRTDMSRFPLPRPKSRSFVQEVPTWIAKKFVSKETIAKLRQWNPDGTEHLIEQCHIDTPLPGGHYHELGIVAPLSVAVRNAAGLFA